MNLTFTYKFSAVAPEAHAAVAGWGEHHLIIGNNLQAGWERRDEGQRSWQERPQSSEQPSNQHFSSTDLSSLEPPLPLVPFEKVKINEEIEKSYFFGVMCTWRTPLPCWCEHAKSFQLSLYKKKNPLQSLKTNTFSLILKLQTCRNLPFCDFWLGANFLMSWM